MAPTFAGMRIAVDAGFLHADDNDSLFIKKLFFKLAEQHIEHDFIFLVSEPIKSLVTLTANITPVIITPRPTNFLRYKWWYDVKVPLALKRYKADIFIGTDGLCSLTTAVPQILIVRNLAFLKHSAFFPKASLSFYKKFTSHFLKKAIAIASFSEFVKKQIIETYTIPAQN